MFWESVKESVLGDGVQGEAVMGECVLVEGVLRRVGDLGVRVLGKGCPGDKVLR